MTQDDSHVVEILIDQLKQEIKSLDFVKLEEMSLKHVEENLIGMANFLVDRHKKGQKITEKEITDFLDVIHNFEQRYSRVSTVIYDLLNEVDALNKNLISNESIQKELEISAFLTQKIRRPLTSLGGEIRKLDEQISQLEKNPGTGHEAEVLKFQLEAKKTEKGIFEGIIDSYKYEPTLLTKIKEAPSLSVKFKYYFDFIRSRNNTIRLITESLDRLPIPDDDKEKLKAALNIA